MYIFLTKSLRDCVSDFELELNFVFLEFPKFFDVEVAVAVAIVVQRLLLYLKYCVYGIEYILSI